MQAAQAQQHWQDAGAACQAGHAPGTRRLPRLAIFAAPPTAPPAQQVFGQAQPAGQPAGSYTIGGARGQPVRLRVRRPARLRAAWAPTSPSARPRPRQPARACRRPADAGHGPLPARVGRRRRRHRAAGDPGGAASGYQSAAASGYGLNGHLYNALTGTLTTATARPPGPVPAPSPVAGYPDPAASGNGPGTADGSAANGYSTNAYPVNGYGAAEPGVNGYGVNAAPASRRAMGWLPTAEPRRAEHQRAGR